jgi:hypothetical protein
LLPIAKARKKDKNCRFDHHCYADGQENEGSDPPPRYIETTIVPEFGEGTSSAVEANQAAPAEAETEGPTAVPKMPIVGPAEAKDDVAKELEVEKTVMLPKILSPPVEA